MGVLTEASWKIGWSAERQNQMQSNADFLHDSLGLRATISNTFSFYKNTFHENIEAEKDQKIKNKL